MKTKLETYQAVVGDKLFTVPFTDSQVHSQWPPSTNAIRVIQARREELRYITYEAEVESKIDLGIYKASVGGFISRAIDRVEALDTLLTSLKTGIGRVERAGSCDLESKYLVTLPLPPSNIGIELAR